MELWSVVPVNTNIEIAYFLPLFCSSVCSLNLALLLRKLVLILLIPHLHPSLLHWPPSSSTLFSFLKHSSPWCRTFHWCFPLETRDMLQASAPIKTNKLTKHRFALLLFYFLIVTLFKIPKLFLGFFLTTTAYSEKYDDWVFSFFFFFNQL